jgi:hypothetical protein
MMKSFATLFDNTGVAPRHRALLLWALVLSASVFSAFVYTVHQSTERGRAIRQQLHARAAAPDTQELVLGSVSLATAR